MNGTATTTSPSISTNNTIPSGGPLEALFGPISDTSSTTSSSSGSTPPVTPHPVPSLQQSHSSDSPLPATTGMSVENERLRAQAARLTQQLAEADKKRTSAEDRVVECQAHIERMRAQVRDFDEKLTAEREDHQSKTQAANQRLAKAMSLIKEEKQNAQEKQELANELERKLNQSKADAAEVVKSQQADMRKKNGQIQSLENEINVLKSSLAKLQTDRESWMKKEIELQKAGDDHREVLHMLQEEKTARERYDFLSPLTGISNAVIHGTG